MMYKIRETQEAVKDVTDLAVYLIENFENPKASHDFLERYDKEIQQLKTFPFGYRGISFEYQGMEIRLKPYATYNIFFVVDQGIQEIIILRVLKDRQNWKVILSGETDYRL